LLQRQNVGAQVVVEPFPLARYGRDTKVRGTNGRSLDRRFAANAAVMRAHVEDLRDKVAVIREGGGAAARRRHLGRGKPLPRERVRALLDPSSSFLECRSSSPTAGMTAGYSSPGSARSWAANAPSSPMMRWSRAVPALTED